MVWEDSAHCWLTLKMKEPWAKEHRGSLDAEKGRGMDNTLPQSLQRGMQPCGHIHLSQKRPPRGLLTCTAVR